MRKLLVNRWQTPDGTILESRHRHDYVEHLDKITGNWMAIDGGTDYVRTVGTFGDFKDLRIYSDDPHVLIREELTWGTRGVFGDQPVKLVPIMDLSTEHINAILDTQWQISPQLREVFQNEIWFRYQKSLEES